MALSPIDGSSLHFDPANTARPTRARFRFQDECVALRCTQNLVSPGLHAVVVEWCSDYLAIAAEGPVELVSIKHREPDQRSWSASELSKPIADLLRYWEAMGRRCRCVFLSNMGVPQSTISGLAAALAVKAAVALVDAQRFMAEVMVFNAPVVPHRDHITAVAMETMRGALIAQDRDPAFADACYTALLARIDRASTEEPSTAVEKATRLAGAMDAVAARNRPALEAQTLPLADLRALVLTTHDDLAREPAHPILVRPKPPERVVDWAGGERIRLGGSTFLLHDPVAVSESPDRTYRFLAANARQLEPTGRDVWLRRVDTLGETGHTVARREALRREAVVLRDLVKVPGAPRLLDVDEGGRTTTLIIARYGRTLLQVYGPLDAPYPPLAVDALLRGLPALGRVLDAMHQRGYAHRDLHPHALMVSGERGALALRDLGRATVAPVPGEGASGYRAPEQDRPLLIAPGPATDVYQLAVLVYQTMAGRLPDPDPVPSSVLRPAVSPAVDEVLLPALRSDPHRRPPVRRWCTALGRLAGAAVMAE